MPSHKYDVKRAKRLIHGEEKIGLTKEELDEIQKRIGITFQNLSLLQQAFVNRTDSKTSLGKIKRAKIPNNERLEFLGDSILNKIVAEQLYRKFPHDHEGTLTDYRGALISGRHLARVADELGLVQFFLFSDGRKWDAAGAAPYFLANTFEALVAAIYLDRGEGAAELFLSQVLLSKIDRMLAEKRYIVPRGYLRKLSWDVYKVDPVYEIIEDPSKENGGQVGIGVFINERLIGSGKGHNKHDAKEAASRDALKKEFGVDFSGADGIKKDSTE